MNYGLYLSASGVLTNLYRQDVFANNLANVHTVGFKPDVATVHQRDPESIEDRTGFEFRNDLLDRLGGGVLGGPQHVDLTPGQLRQTGRELDAALEDRNAFFAVSVQSPRTGASETQLTRDGRFDVSDGFLVTSAGGYRVLDAQNQPIELDGEVPAQITESGGLIQRGAEVAQLHVVSVSDPKRLIKQGGNRFKLDGPDSLRQTLESPHVRPGFVESSGVDPIRALMRVIEATKTATGNGNLIRYHDLLMDRAVNVLGRVLA